MFIFFSWLRRRWNSSPVVIAGAEEEEYRLTLDDVDSSLVFMYTPVTEEGAKGEPQYKYTDFVKAGVWGMMLSYNFVLQISFFLFVFLSKFMQFIFRCTHVRIIICGL